VGLFDGGFIFGRRVIFGDFHPCYKFCDLKFLNLVLIGLELIIKIQCRSKKLR
jgi:hypothetical protein